MSKEESLAIAEGRDYYYDYRPFAKLSSLYKPQEMLTLGPKETKMVDFHYCVVGMMSECTTVAPLSFIPSLKLPGVRTGIAVNRRYIPRLCFKTNIAENIYISQLSILDSRTAVKLLTRH